MSTISATDIEVFKRLANPVVVDVQVESKTRRAAEMRRAMERAAAAVQEEPASPARSARSARSAGSGRGLSAFRQAQEQAVAEAAELLKDRARTQVRPAEETKQEEPAKQEPAKREEGPSKDESSESEAGSWARPERRKRRTTSDSEATRLEKQGFLIELSNMRRNKGVHLSREFTMDDTLAELEFEIQKQNNNATTRQHVVFMRDVMKMGINGLEIANARFGPFLSIDGWAETVTADMTKYEPPLEKLYRRYFRSSQMSPIMELSWLLVGSMVAFHFKNKWFAGPPASKQPPPPRANSPKARATRSTRPVLRPPAPLFGL